jgi:cold shock protein
MSENTTTGVVKWFNNTKGFGFIKVDGLEQDIFVHYSAITGNGYRSLEEGDRVSFDISPGKKGDEARNVQKI